MEENVFFATDVDDEKRGIGDENVTSEGRHLSRRALHRMAVKKFLARRKNLERKRQANERDKLLSFKVDNGKQNGINNTNNNGKFLSLGEKSCGDVATMGPVLVSKWDFAFFFRTVPSDFLKPHAESVDSGGELAPQQSSPLYSEQERSLLLLDVEEERQLTKSVSFKTMKQNNISKSIHVRRVDGVPPLPMKMPLQPGTDLDQPTWSYLLPDPIYNVHQYASGFERDETAAKRFLLGCAVREWLGRDDKVLVLSTGDVLRNLFEATYYEDKPLVLEVKRIGPTLLVDSHSEGMFFTRARDLREKALLGKALCRIHDTFASHDEKIKNNENMNNCGVSDNDVIGSTNGSVMALSTNRVGTLAFAKEIRLLSRYSHVYSWEIGSMEVLVGIDTPIILDCRDNTQLMLRLQDNSVAKTPQENQLSTIKCWFDATLANIPQVGIFVHNDGIVQRYEVKKVQDLLGILESSTAAAAMNCTTNILQWLASQCVKDGMTYAVVRNYDTGFLDIYEYSMDECLEKHFLEGTLDEGGDGSSVGSNNISSSNNNNNGKKDNEENSLKRINNLKSSNYALESGKDEEEEKSRAEENERLNWGLATMCFRMGMHLKDSEQKTPDAISLFLRSLALYFLHRSRLDEACRSLCEIAECLPGLIGRLIASRKVALEEEGVGIIQLPEVYREAFMTCGRFEVRFREAVFDEKINFITRRAFVHSLFSCGAAVCVCVSRAIEEFCVERSIYLRLRAEKSKGSNMHIHSLIAKDLLQVVVEGLLRLEQMSRMLQSETVLTQCTLLGSSVESLALVDRKKDVFDFAILEKTLWELYADVVLLAMSDKTPFTANVLVELSRRIKAREEGVSRGSAGGSISSNGGGTDTSLAGGTTLSWLSVITHDILSLSFTALRFFAKAGSESKRLLCKKAQVYYHVGQHYLLTDRYTKALESLHRANSLFSAMERAPADAVFGRCCTLCATVAAKDVHLSLGEVYTRMARMKSRFAPTDLRLTPHQPLLFGEAQVLSQEEENFYRQAVDHFTNCEANSQLASVLRVFASRQIGHIACSGQQADVAKGRHIYSMLKKVGEHFKNDAVVNWEVLRLFTCTAHHTALQRRVEEILAEWTREAFLAGGTCAPPGLRPTVHQIECTLQVALVYLSLLEATKKLKLPQAMSYVRSCVAHIIIALNEAHATPKTTDAPLLRAIATWKADCSHEWACRVSLMICLRTMRAIMRILPREKASEAGQVLQRLVTLEESECGMRTKAKSCGSKCQFWRLSESLIEILQVVNNW